MFDRLSLYFCTAPPRPASLGPAPVDYSGGEAQLTLRPIAENTVAIAPYPFDHSPLPVAVRACMTADRDYRDDDFRAAFASALPVELQFAVCAE
jgi:hypothetical protein